MHCMTIRARSLLTAKDLVVALEVCRSDLAEDGVVDAGLAGDGVAQPLQRVVPLILHRQRRRGQEA